MRGKLFGIGIGPGDEELLTLKAIKTIEKCKIIAVPSGSDNKMAFNTAQKYIKDKEIMVCEFSMSRNINVRIAHREQVCNQICEVLDKGEDIGFLTIGDPTIYSTYMYIHNMVNDRGYSTEIISGIPSFIASAGKINASLCEGEKKLHIIPTSKLSEDEISDILELDGSKVFMKSGKNLETLLNVIDKKEIKNLKIVERCTLDGEQVFGSSKEIQDLSQLGYFTVVIVKE